jgi:hypothetical protein
VHNWGVDMSYIYWFSASFCTVVAVAENSVPEDGFCDISHCLNWVTNITSPVCIYIMLAITVMHSPGYSLCDLICEVMRCPIGFLNSHPTTCIGWGNLIKWSLRCLFNEAARGERERETNSTDMQLITWTSYALMHRTSKVNFLT